MPEREMAPEIQQEALIAEIDQELKAQPEIPQDRQEIFKSLSRNKEVALAGLVLALGVLASPEAKAEFYYEKPANVTQTEAQILEHFKEGDENTVYRYGQELLSLQGGQTKEETGSVEFGERGRAIINQLSRMMMFCEKHGVEFESVYDTSKIDQKLLESAKKDFSENLALSKEKGQKPLAQGGFERTRPEQEKLRKTSR